MPVADRSASPTTGRPAAGHILLAVLALALFPSASPAAASGATESRPRSTYSQTPSLTEPYAACPPPTPDRAQCQVIVDPQSAPPIPTASSPSASSASGGPQILLCREVFPASEYEFCGSGADHGFSPQDLQSAYRLPSETAGSGQTVAIVDAYDDPNAQADLNVYRSTYDLPPCESGCFTKVNQTGGTTYPEANGTWALEISLDLDMVSAACPKCHILLVEANNNELTNLGIAENEAATLGATEISNSYSAREIEMGKAEVNEDSGYYNHSGVLITAASGDDGYDNENPERQNEKNECTNCSTSFPASLNTVIAVGGTYLKPEGTSGRGWEEYVWGASGSGCTLYITKPAWQTDKGCKNRTDNDVAAVAEGVSLYDTYPYYTAEPGWQVVTGTSISTPLTAGAIALESSSLRSEGIEGIYKHTANWYDVTEGNNWAFTECAEKYLCNGEVGYDGPTGVGTADGGAAGTPPSAWTEPASGVTTSAGTLNGIVNPEADEETIYYFQYGSSTYYGRTAPSGGAKTSGYTEPHLVSQTISGLQASTLYHYRVVAENAHGTTYGADKTFSTAPKVYAFQFGSKGSAEGELKKPQFTALNAQGDVWVSDYGNDRVEEFSPSGGFIRSCGKAGSGEVEFDDPTGIAVADNGRLYISDSGNNRVEVINEACEYWDSFGEGYLSDPKGLTFTRGGEFNKGLVLVANSGDDDIEEFNTGTELIGEKKIQRWEGSYGSKGSGEGQFIDPTDVTFAGVESQKTQAFYVVDSGNDRVQKFSESGLYTFGGEEKLTFKFDEAFGSQGSQEGHFLAPTAIAIDPATGDLDITDTEDSIVEEFLPTGTYITSFGLPGFGNRDFEKPVGIAAAANGQLYIGDSGNSRITVWGPSQTATAEWSILSTPQAPHGDNSYLWGVSCVAEVTCSAVGEYVAAGNGSSEPMAERWNGIEWILQKTPSPTGAKYGGLYGASCASAGWCIAVGSYRNSSGTYFSLPESWIYGTGWQIQSMPEPSGTLNSGLDAVACTSSSACTTVGEYENGSGAILPFAERWNGTEWKVQTMPNPTGAKETYTSGVSCTSSSGCTMVGTYKNSSSVYVPYAEEWNGTEWKLQSMPTPTGATATRMQGGVSCASASACTGVGYYVNSSGVEVTLAERWNGTEWAVQTTPNRSEMKSSAFNGVSCASTSVCSAVGVSVNSAGKAVTLAEQWNGTEWKSASTPNDEEGEGQLTGGVSCVEAPVPCLAVGNTGTETFAEIYG
jgi:hypothetical protein